MTISHPNALLVQQLVRETGEADQAYRLRETLDRPLALRRARLRMELANHASSKEEKIHFLGEATGILEMLLSDPTDEAERLTLSVELAQAYFDMYVVRRIAACLTITDQLLRGYAHMADSRIFRLLALSSAFQGHPAMTRYWTGKYLQSPAYQQDWWQHEAYQPYQPLPWFKQLVKNTTS